MYILGVNISHHPSTCLLKDGEVLWYIENERIAKKKGIHIENPIGFNTAKFVPHHVDHLMISSFGSADHDPRRIELVIKGLKTHGGSFSKIQYNPLNHHKYHAANAFYSSGFEECIAIVIDGYGACRDDKYPHREIESTYHCSYPNNIVELDKHYSVVEVGPNTEPFVYDGCLMSNSLSVGMMFAYGCKNVGLDSGQDAGKLMGMAAYATKDLSGDWFTNGRANNAEYLTAVSNLKSFRDYANFACKLQQETKKHTIQYIRNAIERYRCKNIVLSGGYFLNCVNNYAYVKEFPDINFYIDPISHDGGTSLGAAKLLWYNLTKDTTIRKMKNLYLGPTSK